MALRDKGTRDPGGWCGPRWGERDPRETIGLGPCQKWGRYGDAVETQVGVEGPRLGKVRVKGTATLTVCDDEGPVGPGLRVKGRRGLWWM